MELSAKVQEETLEKGGDKEHLSFGNNTEEKENTVTFEQINAITAIKWMTVNEWKCRLGRS